MLKVEKINITKKSITETKELSEINKLMIKYGIKEPLRMLPQSDWHEVSFNLKNTYAGFANGIRRVLIEELPVVCLSFYEDNLVTDDDFILSDLLVKNINLIPINQEINMEDYDKYDIFLYKYNDTNDIIDVKASDIRVVLSEKKKLKKGSGDKEVIIEDEAESNSDEEEKEKRINKKDKPKYKSQTKGGVSEERKLIPESNIIIIRLRPGKYIKITHMFLEEGFSKNNASKFSLLNNVKYEPTDMIPYDVNTGTGTRSIEYDPKEFALSFSTCCNIQPHTVIKLVCNTLTERLNRCKEKLLEYMKSDQSKKYYYAEGFEVTIKDDIYYYKYSKEYITLAYMIAQRCFLLDANILYCSPAIDRYDNEIAIIKLKHADSNKLLLKSLDSCLDDIKILKSEFDKAKIV